MQYATASDGVRIAFGTAVQGPYIIRAPSPPFSHCQLEWSNGSEFYRELAANWSIARFDPRGTGLSDRQVDDLSLEARMRDLEAVVDKLGLQRFVLHAIGFNGPMAVTYAVQNPDRVSHLILDDTIAQTANFMRSPFARALDKLAEEWDSFLEYMVFTFYGLGREQGRPYVEYLRACVTQEVALRFFRQVRDEDVASLLPQVSVPTLVLQHTGLTPHNFEAARDMAARIPNARFVVLEGTVADDTMKIIRSIGELLGTGVSIAPGEPAADTRTAGSVRAILFTDVVGHTEMMARLGDAPGRETLREHEQITREVLRRHGGDEVKSLGDGFMASFASVAGAVECAIALQRAFEARNERTGAGDDGRYIHIRIGLNAGEPIEEGGDFFGATVIMASRIAAQAGPGEILASDVVRGLCSGKGFSFVDRGENVLRGFDDPVHLYEIRWAT
jgi:class 3 adenylate cyclase